MKTLLILATIFTSHTTFAEFPCADFSGEYTCTEKVTFSLGQGFRLPPEVGEQGTLRDYTLVITHDLNQQTINFQGGEDYILDNQKQLLTEVQYSQEPTSQYNFLESNSRYSEPTYRASCKSLSASINLSSQVSNSITRTDRNMDFFLEQELELNLDQNKLQYTKNYSSAESIFTAPTAQTFSICQKVN